MVLIGAYGAIVYQQPDVVEVLLLQGFAMAAMAMLLLNIWSTQDNTIYNFAVAGCNLLRTGRRKTVTLAGAVIGTLLALLGMYDMLVPYLILLGTVIPPIGGVIMADFSSAGAGAIRVWPTHGCRRSTGRGWGLRGRYARRVPLAVVRTAGRDCRRRANVCHRYRPARRPSRQCATTRPIRRIRLMHIINARLRNQEGLHELHLEDGLIRSIGRQTEAPTLNPGDLDAGGDLVVPPFVEPHIHLDATLTAGEPRWNMSGTLFEGIECWANARSPSPKKTPKPAPGRPFKPWPLTAFSTCAPTSTSPTRSSPR